MRAGSRVPLLRHVRSRLYFVLGRITRWPRSAYRHVKDLIILTSGVQVLSLVSNYFWLLWLLVSVYLQRNNAFRSYFFYSTSRESLCTRKKVSRMCVLVTLHAGTVERRLVALEANPVPVVFLAASRTA